MNSNAHFSTLTCPNPACGHQQQALMPTTFCQLTYTCQACSMTYIHKSGDCCVFCSYADKPCPSMQDEETCCSPSLPGKQVSHKGIEAHESTFS
ncbi:GDCCVxC domain-containing (seleno)protein [Reticulibacter mediterranei]|uniref:GDCCVxC domain-containing (seleno)protein n=1 Tax=Reticulibacter mediterranei TaxID=2778369 RepID=UPI0035709992